VSSFLQRISEYLEYAKLLEQANLSDDPVERLQVNGQNFLLSFVDES